MKIKHLYVHIPFCDNICYYCDFTRVKYNAQLVDKYLDKLEAELVQYNLNKDISTIYIGGGTPSSLTSQQLYKLLNILKKYSQDTIEYTIEANPDSLTLEKINILKKFKVNRVSLGVQTANDSLLKAINRKHSYNDVINVVDSLNSAGISNISIDLIYSLPKQTMKIWQETLETIVSLNIKHISLYSLTIEKNSYFNRHHYQKLDDETEANMYFYAIDFLKKYSFEQYEIANFSKKGYESKHNLGYWNYDNFIGIGLGASGKISNYRYDNTKNFVDYFNEKFVTEKIELSVKDQMFEMLMMSLRLKKGISKKLFYERFNKNIEDVFKDVINIHVLKNNLINTEYYLKCSDKGFPILNDILVDFM